MSENKITFPVKLASNNPQSFGIVDAIEVSGHKSVDTLSDLYAISDPVLSVLKDGSDAIGQEWFVVSEDCKYRLDNWANRKSVAGWTKLPKQELVNTKQSVSEKDQPGGYAGLDSNGKLPIEKTYGTTATVVNVNTYASLPVTGSSGVIYYVSNTSAQYKWSGSAYIDITGGADNAKKNETSIFDCSNGTSTKYYSSLSAAINIVPPVYRTSNRIISYLSTENATTKAVNYQYNGIDSTTWTDLTKWERIPNQSDLTEIQSDLTEIRSDLNETTDKLTELELKVEGTKEIPFERYAYGYIYADGNVVTAEGGNNYMMKLVLNNSIKMVSVYVAVPNAGNKAIGFFNADDELIGSVTARSNAPTWFRDIAIPDVSSYAIISNRISNLAEPIVLVSTNTGKGVEDNTEDIAYAYDDLNLANVVREKNVNLGNHDGGSLYNVTSLLAKKYAIKVECESGVYMQYVVFDGEYHNIKRVSSTQWDVIDLSVYPNIKSFSFQNLGTAKVYNLYVSDKIGDLARIDATLKEKDATIQAVANNLKNAQRDLGLVYLCNEDVNTENSSILKTVTVSSGNKIGIKIDSELPEVKCNVIVYTGTYVTLDTITDNEWHEYTTPTGATSLSVQYANGTAGEGDYHLRITEDTGIIQQLAEKQEVIELKDELGISILAKGRKDFGTGAAGLFTFDAKGSVAIKVRSVANSKFNFDILTYNGSTYTLIGKIDEEKWYEFNLADDVKHINIQGVKTLGVFDVTAVSKLGLLQEEEQKHEDTVIMDAVIRNATTNQLMVTSNDLLKTAGIYVFYVDNSGNYTQGISLLARYGDEYRRLEKGWGDVYNEFYYDGKADQFFVQNNGTAHETVRFKILKRCSQPIKRTYHVAKDGSGEYTSFLRCFRDAMKYMDSTIYVHRGVYDLVEEFKEYYGENFFDYYIADTLDASIRGIILCNRMKIVCSPDSVFEFNYTGNNAGVHKFFSPFNTHKYGCHVFGMTIECSNCRYCVHNDRGGWDDPYVELWEQCSFYLDNTENEDWGYQRICMGAGMGTNGHLRVVNCIFQSDGVQRDAIVGGSHNANAANAKSMAWWVGNMILPGRKYQFADTFHAGDLGSTTKITRYIFTGNVVGKMFWHDNTTGQGTVPNMEVLEWNNTFGVPNVVPIRDNP